MKAQALKFTRFIEQIFFIREKNKENLVFSFFKRGNKRDFVEFRESMAKEKWSERVGVCWSQQKNKPLNLHKFKNKEPCF